MKYYSILHLISYNYPNSIFYFTMLLFITMILLLYWYISVTLREIRYKFSRLFSKTAFKRFDMKDRGEYINVSLFYKLYSVPFTIMESIFYFLLVIFSIFLLRVIRLGTTIDSYEILYKINHSLIITKLLYIILVIFYIFLLKQYLDSFTSRLYYTLKKLYIYLLQVGGLFDIVHYREGHNKDSYVRRYFQSPITRLYDFIRSLYDVYKPTVLYDPNHYAHKNSKTLYEFYITSESSGISGILVPLFYFIQLSKYKDTKFVALLKITLNKINDSRWIVLYSFPVIVLLLTIFYEYFYKQGILSNIYTVLLVIFVYKIYLDLMYFFEEGCLGPKNELLCVYYYVYDKLDPSLNKNAMTTVLAKYAALTRRDMEHELNVYIENHLNGNKVREIKLGEEYTKFTSKKINIRVKNFLVRLKLLQYLLLFINAMADYFYDRDSFAISKKAFLDALFPMSNITKWLLSKELISILTLICIFSSWFFSPEFLPLLYIPLVILYLLKIFFHRKINLLKLVILCYGIFIVTLYTFYTKHYNILYMDEILWNYGIEISQYFTVQEKIKYFKEYLHYITYVTANKSTAFDKREFLSLIDFKLINTMIDENTKLSDLKQLAQELLLLNPSLIRNNLDNLNYFNELTDTVVIKQKTLFQFIESLLTVMKKFLCEK